MRDEDRLGHEVFLQVQRKLDLEESSQLTHPVRNRGR